VGNARKGKRKGLNAKEMKEKDHKWRKWGVGEEGTERVKERFSGLGGKMRK
jgi:hypothetical protein